MTAKSQTDLKALIVSGGVGRKNDIHDIIDSIPILNSDPGNGIQVGDNTNRDLQILFDLVTDRIFQWKNSASRFELTDNLHVSGTLGVSGATTLSGDLSVSGATDLDGTLSVSGASTFSSSVDINGPLTVSGTSTFSSSVDINGPLTVSGISTFSSSVDINGPLTVSGISTFSGSVTVKSLSLAVVTKTTNYTATAADNLITCDASGGAFTITLPALSGILGREYIIKKVDSSGLGVTLKGNGSETTDGELEQVITTQYINIVVRAGASEWHIIY